MFALTCVLKVGVSFDFLPRNAFELSAELFDFVFYLFEITDFFILFVFGLFRKDSDDALVAVIDSGVQYFLLEQVLSVFHEFDFNIQ